MIIKMFILGVTVVLYFIFSMLVTFVTLYLSGLAVLGDFRRSVKVIFSMDVYYPVTFS